MHVLYVITTMLEILPSFYQILNFTKAIIIVVQVTKREVVEITVKRSLDICQEKATRVFF